MPIYNSLVKRPPANRLAYPDTLSATPRNEYIGALADFLAKSYSPERTQQMQGTARFLGAPAISQTLDRLSYGEPLTTGAGGLGGTTRIRPEALEAGMTVAPMIGPSARASTQAAMVVGRAGERYAERVVPEILNRGGMPAQMLQDLAQGTRRNIFIGENSKTWNAANAAKAVEMEKAGVAPEEIWAATGTFRGPEGKLRQEISDKGSKITEEVFNQISANKQFKGPMAQGLAHEELYNAYPQTGQIPTLMFADITPSGTILKGKPGTFQIGQITAGGPSTMDQRSVALHELQHAIQQREGFPGGGSPRMFKPNDVFTTQALEDSAIIDKLMRGSNLDQYQAQQRFESLFKRKPTAGAFAALERIGTGQELDAARDASRLADNPMESYRRLAGEAEARAVQKRRNLTPEQRLATFPYESYDVPINQLIVRTP